MKIRAVVTVALGAGVLALLSGCSLLADPGPQPATDGRLSVVASFYPLQYVTQRIAGSHAVVTSLTPPGAEPHDLELTPKDVAGVDRAQLVVYLKGFQPAVDDAVSAETRGQAEDVAPAADLDRTLNQDGESNGTDPHFWLDPERLEAVSARIEGRLVAVDPEHAADYRNGLASLTRDLTALDTEYRTGLAKCADKDLVTSHEAFGYLAQRYGLDQVGITGLIPDAEPDPGVLAQVSDFVEKNHVRTIYYETLVSPAIADTVARETGARTEVLDPIEGLTKQSQGRDYLAVMRANLRNLQEGQPCS
jgi:zinc transport system substrate-binding protein